MVRFIRKSMDTQWPGLLWTLMIFILLTIGSGSFEKASFLIEGLPNFDKIVHAILFGILVFLWWRYLMHKTKRINSFQILTLLFISASAYGIGMEFYQEQFTSREFELGDIYADIAGAGVSALICSYIKNKPLWK